MRSTGVDSGLFFTTLVKTQTNVETPQKRQPAWRTEGLAPTADFDDLVHRSRFRSPPATPVEQAFRHGGWQLERLRVRTALLTANVPQSRYERFCECGNDCVVEWSPERKRHRTRANYCGDRFCLPCARARAFRVRQHLERLCDGRLPLFITLTIRNKPQSLTAALNHLLRSFRRLRQQKLWSDHITAGAAFVEIKKGARSGEWHPHLHIIAMGTFLPGQELSDAWFKATGDSTRVDIKRARDATASGSYAAKYASKGWTSEVTRDADALVECVLSLRGRRLCTCFGEWHGVDVESDDTGPNDWQRVGRLHHVYERFIAGEQWAAGVMKSLGAAECLEQTNLPRDESS